MISDIWIEMAASDHTLHDDDENHRELKDQVTGGKQEGEADQEQEERRRKETADENGAAAAEGEEQEETERQTRARELESTKDRKEEEEFPLVARDISEMLPETTVVRPDPSHLLMPPVSTGGGWVAATRSIQIYPLELYSFASKEVRVQKNTSVAARISRMKRIYAAEGQIKTVQGVMLVHRGGHPHVLLLKIGSFFNLPGGRLKPGQDEREGLLQKLTRRLAPSGVFPPPQWEIDELLSIWWRPNFENYVYPYLPAHITKPKESVKLFLIPLPETMALACPKNFELVAIPLFELYDNASCYGPIIASIPHVLARFNLVPVSAKH